MPTRAHLGARWDDAVIGCTGVTAAGAVLALGCRPTGSPVVDVVVVSSSVTMAIWACATAPWWAIAVLAVVGASLAVPLWAMAFAACGLLATVGLGATRRLTQLLAATSAAVSVSALATLGNIGAFGVSSAIAISLVGACAITGITRRPRHIRRHASVGALAVGSICAIGFVGLAVSALSARSEIAEGEKAAREGLAQLRRGETDTAKERFATASVLFRQASIDLRRPWAQLARLVPIAAQHRAAATDVSDASASATRALTIELSAVDLDALQLVDGRIDVDAVAALHEPMSRVNGAIGMLGHVVDSARSGWLIPRVADRLDALDDELEEHRSLGEKTADALAVAPAMLGAEGERVYFVMFTTPAEARGQGGFMGNYAVLTIDHGLVELTDLGRHEQLSRAGVRPRTLDGAPEDWLARYGPFGFTTGPDGSVGNVPWANITMSPNFPSTAEVVAELFPQSGGRAVDGVISLDVFALQELVRLVGPIEIEGSPVPLTGRNTANFLLVGQYDIADTDTRTDLLEDVARETFNRLLGGSAPEPIRLGRVLHPMAQQRRLMAWSSHPDEQRVITAADLDGAVLADLEREDGFAIAVVNAGGSKIDTFLARDVTVTGVDGEPDRIELDIEFINTPRLSLPDYVVGNIVGLPRGWSRLYVSVYSSMPLVSASDSSGPLPLQPGLEAGVPVFSTYIEIPPDGSVNWVLELERSPNATGPPKIISQPLVIPENLTVDLDAG